MTTIDAIHAADDETKRSRIGAALAKGYIFCAVLLAALAPLIANGRPLTMIGEDGGRIWPVFRALTRADAFWLAGAAFLPGATLIGLLLARFSRGTVPVRRTRIRAAL